jgi:N-acetyl-beta-hexosaminidase
MIVTVLFAVACGHAHEAEVVSSYEPRATIGQTFTVDTTRLSAAAGDEGVVALTTLLATHLGAVGQLRPVNRAADRVDVIADLPAPGWALRARITPKPENLCLVAVEPIATQPTEHAVDSAPFSVQDAYDEVRRRIPPLSPSKLPPMSPERFARLRAEAAAAAAEGKDPLLTPTEYVRVPRPLSSEGEDRPYLVPPSADESQKDVERKE